jgi:hypothetical protein
MALELIEKGTGEGFQGPWGFQKMVGIFHSIWG